MNIRSVRFRLTVWYSLAFFIATIVIYTSFYLVTKQALFNQIDTTLTSHGNKVVEVITRSGQDMHQTMNKQSFLNEFSEIRGMLLAVMDNSGKIASNSTVSDVENRVFTENFEMAKEKDTSFLQNQKLGEISMRFFVTPIRQNNIFFGIVLIGHPIDVIEKSLTNLLVMLGVVFTVFIIPTIVGGSLLASGATQPIAKMSEKLKKITSENLDERVGSPKTGDEVEELAITFNNLLDRLNQSFNRERQFIGDVAHELKTPLATQRSNVEITLSKNRNIQAYKQTLSEILIDNNRITTTLKNILDLAWGKAENVNIQLETVNLSDLMEELKDLGVKMAYKKGIKIESSIEPKMIISGKRDKLERAIINIIDNAVKYTSHKGEVIIKLTKKKSNALIQIVDTGIGIAVKDLPHIFERFYRGSKTDKTFGSGLGLAIAQAIISAHHGKISVDSKVGKGTIFSILLPKI